MAHMTCQMSQNKWMTKFNKTKLLGFSYHLDALFKVIYKLVDVLKNDLDIEIVKFYYNKLLIQLNIRWNLNFIIFFQIYYK